MFSRARTRSQINGKTREQQEEEQLEAARRFRVGQPVWPVLSCNGKPRLGQKSEVVAVGLRISVKTPGQRKPVDYHPNNLSDKGP